MRIKLRLKERSFQSLSQRSSAAPMAVERRLARQTILKRATVHLVEEKHGWKSIAPLAGPQRYWHFSRTNRIGSPPSLLARMLFVREPWRSFWTLALGVCSFLFVFFISHFLALKGIQDPAFFASSCLLIPIWIICALSPGTVGTSWRWLILSNYAF